jgi:hypothetical protein
MGVSSAIESLGASTLLLHGGVDIAKQLTDFHVEFVKAADDGAAATTTANTKFWSNPYPFPVQLVDFKYSADGAITASDTDFATIQIKFDDAAAGTPAVGLEMKTQTTAAGGTGNVVAQIQKSSTGVGTTVVCPVGGNLWFAIAKAGTGVVVRAGRITVRLRRTGS